MRKLSYLAALAALFAATIASSPAHAGTFLIGCNFDHVGYDDPIVSPGQPSGHLHELAGSIGINPFSTLDSMQEAGTTCDLPGDTAGYWFPAMIGPNGNVIASRGPNIYYLNPGNGKVHPFPEGLKHVQGDPTNTSTARYAATFGCGVVTNRVTIPTSCAPGQGFRMSIYFPDCWNGRDLDNATHKTLGTCGTTGFKNKVPRLQYFVDYPPEAVGGHLSSDAPGAPPGTSMHADFFNSWDPFVHAEMVDKCVNVPDRQCRVDVDQRAVIDVAATGRPVIFTF